MISASLTSIVAARSALAQRTMSNEFSAPPALAGYSPVPSLKQVATQHSAAMAASSGSSVAVRKAIQSELHWASENLDSIINALQVHEADMAGALARTGRRGVNLEMGLGATAHNFSARPAFHSGSLVYTLPVLTAELAMPTEALLGQFAATNDAAAVAAADYWRMYAVAMDDIATTLSAVAGNLTSSNTGEVFTAASAMLSQLGARAAKVAASSTIIAGHLDQLPAIKSMAVGQLQMILDSTAVITNPVRREMVQQAETKAFLTGAYLPQLTAAVPAVQTLTIPLHGGISALSAGAPTVTQGTSVPTPDFNGAEALRAATAAVTSAPNVSDAVPPVTSTIAEATPTGAGALNPVSMAPSATAPVSTGAPTTGSGTPSPAGMTPTTGVLAPGAQAPVGTGATMPGPLNPAALGQPATAAGATAGGGSGVGTSHIGRPGMKSGGWTGVTGAGGMSTGFGPGMGSTSGVGTGNGYRPGIGSGGQGLNDPHAPGRAGAGAHAHHTTHTPTGGRGVTSAHGTTGAAVLRGAPSGGRDEGEPKAHHIRKVPAKFEQDRFQRQLFGDRPITVPGIIGANVCRDNG